MCALFYVYTLLPHALIADVANGKLAGLLLYILTTMIVVSIPTHSRILFYCTLYTSISYTIAYITLDPSLNTVVLFGLHIINT